MALVVKLPEFLSNPMFGIGLTLASGFLFYYLGKRSVKPRMAYQMHEFSIIARPEITKLGKIEILYNGNPVPRVTVSQVALWNVGSTTVRGQDVVDADPLAILIDNGTNILDDKSEQSIIYDAQVVKAARPVNGFQITRDEKQESRARITFDYMDAKDGATFQLLHTGIQGKTKVTGSIRGVKKGVENFGDLRDWTEQRNSWLGLVFGLAVIGVLWILYQFAKYLVGNHPLGQKILDWLVTTPIVLLGIAMALGILFSLLYTIWLRTRIAPKRLVGS